jgi:N-acetylglucosaminyl-diphospho-decaprenol L-rhamnosyltransferase
MKGIPDFMDLSVIIVSYNTADLIGPCLSSLEAGKHGRHEVFVVDNASQDGSADMIRRRFPEVHLIANSANTGFAAANNQILNQCRGDFILFLNPDTQALPDTLEKATAYLRVNPHIGLAGAKIINPDGTIQESVSYRYPGEKYTRGDLPLLKGNIACVLGAAMIGRREIMQAVGGFDEDFFLYGEDEDLCFRVRKTGWEIGYIEEAVVIHLGGQSERLTLSAEKWRKKVRAEYLFYKKHYHAETIARIRRMERLKARWRLFTIGMAMPFLPDKIKASEKLGRYRVILEETERLPPSARRFRTGA